MYGRVVPYREVKDDYITVNMNGISHYKGSDVTFMTLEYFESNRILYNYLRKVCTLLLSFF
jgi:hypothetical protein